MGATVAFQRSIFSLQTRTPQHASKILPDTWAIIMMAGMGTRMKSKIPKVLHQVCGQSMAQWVLDACNAAGIENRLIVVGYEADKVMEEFRRDFRATVAAEGDRSRSWSVWRRLPRPHREYWSFGDVPCLKPWTIAALLKLHVKAKCDATVLSFFPPDPCGYGRIMRDDHHRFVSIIEDKDIEGDPHEMEECNSGIYVFQRDALAKGLKAIKPSARSGEYHLPDVLTHILKSGGKVEAAPVFEWMEAMGVNSRISLPKPAIICAGKSPRLTWRTA